MRPLDDAEDFVVVPSHRPSVPFKLHNIRQQERKDYGVGPSRSGQKKKRHASLSSKRNHEVSLSFLICHVVRLRFDLQALVEATAEHTPPDDTVVAKRAVR